MARPTTSLLTPVTVDQLADGKYIRPVFLAMNPGSAGVVTELELSGITGLSMSPESGDETEIFQFGAGNQSRIEESGVNFSGTISIHAGDLKSLLAMHGITGGAWNATDGYGASLRSAKNPVGHIVCEVMVRQTVNVNHYIVIPCVYLDNFGFDYTIDDLATIEIPIRSDEAPLYLASQDASNNDLYVNWEILAYNDTTLAKVPVKVGQFPGMYDDDLIHVREFSSSSDKVGTMRTDITHSSDGDFSSTGLVSGEFLGVLYLHADAAPTP